MIKKADIILGLCLIILGIAFALYPLNVSGAGILKVSVDGKQYGTYSLLVDRKIKIENQGHVNVFEIRDGRVKMIKSSCKNQVCVHSRSIARTPQSIVCLPNHVMLEIVKDNGKKEGLDAVSN